MYTKIQFGKDLKKRVEARQSLVDIAQWAFDIYLDYEVEGFIDVLEGLSFMEMGPEFELPYDKLDQIADDFITGKGYKWPTVDPNVPYNNRSTETRKLITKIEFGKELKERVKKRQPLAEIAEWAFIISIDNDIEGFFDVLDGLSLMNFGSGYTLSYEKLDRIADDFISGKGYKWPTMDSKK